MEYSKDIILGVNYLGGQASKDKEGRFVKLIKKHNLLATISIICGILIVLDYVLVHNFMVTLQLLS